MVSTYVDTFVKKSHKKAKKNISEDEGRESEDSYCQEEPVMFKSSLKAG